MSARTLSPRHDRLLEAAAVEALERLGLPSEELSQRLDPVYTEAREENERIVREIGLTAAAIAPPPGLKARLMERIGAEIPSDEPLRREPDFPLAVLDGVEAVRTSDVGWTPAPIPGVAYKVLAHDDARASTTRLVRFDRGVSYPTHRHGGVEEIYVIEGSIQVNGIVLRAGDYCRSLAGTEESGSLTETGALAIIVSSDADEIAPPV